MAIRDDCLVCEDIAEIEIEDSGNRRGVWCDGCGKYTITVSAIRILSDHPEKRALVSHWIRRASDRKQQPLVVPEILEQILAEERPSIPEQADSLLLYLGDTLVESGKPEFSIQVTNYREIVAKIGATPGRPNNAALGNLIDGLGAEGLVLPKHLPQYTDRITLTFAGWRRYSDLKKQRVDSMVAFMAMPFGNPLLDKVFAAFRESISKTGFRLFRIDERPPAGSIDDRLRVEIRRARFTVCELTGANPGAYWEGGYAEGLGRPVIYSCEKSFFDEKKTHFDTNHSHTIVWQESDLADAAQRMRDTVRATLPLEAKMTDD